MKKHYALGFLLMLITVSESFAQTLTVRDAKTNQPLEWVSVYGENSSVYALTNSKGQADLSAFKNLEVIIVRMVGYQPQKFSYKSLETVQFLVTLEPSTSPLDEVVVSASRWEQNRRNLPVKIATISNEDTYFQNPQTAADLLSASGKVFVQKSQLGGGSPMIRGFSTNRVLMTVDGVRMNSAIFRGGNLQNVISVDPLAVGKTEVIFGPASVIYGSDAIGGVMNFYTLQPVFSNGGEAYFSANSMLRASTANDEQTGHLDFGLGFNKWAFQSSFTYSDFGDLRMGTHGPTAFLRDRYVKRINGEDVQLVNKDPRNQVPSGYNQNNWMQKVSFKPNENWQLDGSFYFSSTSQYSRFDRLLRPRGDNLRSAEWYYGPQQWLLSSLSLSHSADSKWYDKYKVILAYQKFEESRHDRDLNKVDRNNTSEKVDAYSVNADFTKKLGTTKTLNYGVEYVLNHIESNSYKKNIETGERQADQTRYPDGSSWQSVAVYTGFSWEINPKLTFQSGLRYNFVSIQADLVDTFIPLPFKKIRIDNGALTGSIGISWIPEQTWQINLNGSTGFRAPNIDDVGKIFDSEPGSLVVPNPDLDPEYAWNGELGVIKKIGGFLTLEVTGYYTRLQDALVRRDFTFNGSNTIFFDGEESNVQAIQNAAKAYVYGLELGVDAKISHNLSFTANGNYQEGDEELDDGSKAPLRHAAPFFGDAHFIYQIGNFKADFYGIYNAEVSFNNLAPSEIEKPYLYDKDENGNPFAPSWHTLNLRTQYRFNKNLSVSADVENLTDRRYRPYSSGITAAGLNFIFSVRASL